MNRKGDDRSIAVKKIAMFFVLANCEKTFTKFNQFNWFFSK